MPFIPQHEKHHHGDDNGYKTDECNFCECEYASDSIRFQCVDCKDFNACPNCYLAQVSYRRHSPEHRFYARSDFDFPIWQDGWTLHDDLTLLEGIEVFGFGSWKEIADYMQRPAGEPVEALPMHYFYVYGENGALYNKKPEHSNNVSMRSFIVQQQYTETQDFDILLTNYFNHTHQFDDQVLNQTLNLTRFPGAKHLPPTRNYGELPKDTGEGTGQNYSRGIWPKRADFGWEPMNKAEFPVMNLTFNPLTETKNSMQLKLAVLQTYADRLVAREEMKNRALQASFHRPDRRVDAISQQADCERDSDQKPPKFNYSNPKFTLNQTANFGEGPAEPADNLPWLEKFETEHPWLLRAFRSRAAMRQHVLRLAEERRTRINIFYMQIATMMGYKEYSEAVVQQVIGFLQNPKLEAEILKNLFPPGCVEFQAVDKPTEAVVNHKVLLRQFDKLCAEQGLKNEKDILKAIDQLVDVKNISPQSIWSYLSNKEDEVPSKAVLCQVLINAASFQCVGDYYQHLKQFQSEIIEKFNNRRTNQSEPIRHLQTIEEQMFTKLQLMFSRVCALFDSPQEACQALTPAITGSFSSVNTIAVLFVLMTTQIAFGLSYREAKTGDDKVTLNNVGLDARVADLVQKQYFPDLSPVAIPILQQLFQGLKFDTTSAIEGQFYGQYVSGQPFFSQVGIDPAKLDTSSPEIYCAQLNINCPVTDELFMTYRPSSYVKPIAVLATAACFMRKTCCSGFTFSNLLMAAAAAAGFGARTNSILFTEITTKNSATRTLDFPVEIDVQNDLLTKAHEAARSSAMVIQCNQQHFYSVYPALIGQTPSAIPLKSLTLKQRTAVIYHPNMKPERGFLKRREKREVYVAKRPENNVQMAARRQISLVVLNEQQLTTALKVLEAFTNSFEEQLKQLALRNGQNNKYQDNASLVFARVEKQIAQFNEAIARLAIPREIIASELLKQNKVGPDPLDYIFGPQLKPFAGSETDLQLLKTNVQKSKLRVSSLNFEQQEERRKGRVKDETTMNGFLQKFTTRGDMALCVIAGIEPGTYAQCKVSYIYNGFVITDQIVAAMEHRPGIAEVMAYMTIAQFANPECQTVPRFDEYGSQTEWHRATASNFLAKKAQAGAAVVTLQLFFSGKPVLVRERFDVLDQQTLKKTAQVSNVPTVLLTHAQELKDKSAADAVYERAKQHVWNSQLNAEYRKYRNQQLGVVEYNRPRSFAPEQTKKMDAACQTVKSYVQRFKLIQKGETKEEAQEELKLYQEARRLRIQRQLERQEREKQLAKQAAEAALESEQEAPRRGRPTKNTAFYAESDLVPTYDFPEILPGMEGVFARGRRLESIFIKHEEEGFIKHENTLDIFK